MPTLLETRTGANLPTWAYTPLPQKQYGPGAITSFRDSYRFLSNFSSITITVKGKSFGSVEHAFQWCKAMYAGDELTAARLEHRLSPVEAKRLGREVANLPADWSDMRVTIMRALLKRKFAHPGLAAQLRRTGSVRLVEGNYWHDNFWGTCECTRCGQGQNMLGRLLMEIREHL